MPFTAEPKLDRFRTNPSQWTAQVLLEEAKKGNCLAVGAGEFGRYGLVHGRRHSWIIFEDTQGAFDAGQPMSKEKAASVWKEVEQDYYAYELECDSERR